MKCISRIDSRYDAKTVRIGALEIKADVRATVRHQWSDGSCDVSGDDGLNYFVPRNAIPDDLWPLAQGTRVIITPQTGERGDVAARLVKE